MKLVCSCGNEMKFIPYEKQEESEFGILMEKDMKKFDFWAEHDQAGITCEKCKKAIWYFT